jgi:hypothetical protein
MLVCCPLQKGQKQYLRLPKNKFDILVMFQNKENFEFIAID